MKLSELMAGITPAPEYEGPVSADDYVLAIGLSGSETGPATISSHRRASRSIPAR